MQDRNVNASYRSIYKISAIMMFHTPVRRLFTDFSELMHGMYYNQERPKYEEIIFNSVLVNDIRNK